MLHNPYAFKELKELAEAVTVPTMLAQVERSLGLSVKL